MDGVQDSITRKYKVLGELFDERERRLWAAVEASELGRRGISLIARATGLSRNTISRGIEELARIQPGERLPGESNAPTAVDASP